MPIITPASLPINRRLIDEDISVMTREDAEHQDIRPQEIALLNLMPNKQRTEKQLARLLGDTPLQVALTLMNTGSYQGKNESQEHLAQFYQDWEKVSHRKFDGLIITGAPVEHMEFSDVDYWEELKDIFQWARENVYARLYICWGAQAALHHSYGIEKTQLPEKAFGVFPHTSTNWRHPLTKGFDDVFPVPVSRHTEIQRFEVERVPELEIIAESDQTGLYIVQNLNGRDTYIFNHPEYGAKTLQKEYVRDLAKYEADIAAGKTDVHSIQMPENYFPDNDPTRCPRKSWRSHSRVLFENWLNQYVYQRTPFNLQEVSDETVIPDAPDFQI